MKKAQLLGATSAAEALMTRHVWSIKHGKEPRREHGSPAAETTDKISDDQSL
jgi:hypothetical protein